MIKIWLLDFQNPTWWIQHDGKKFEKSLDLAQNCYTEVFEGADHDLSISNFLLKNGRVGLWSYPNIILTSPFKRVHS